MATAPIHRQRGRPRAVRAPEANSVQALDRALNLLDVLSKADGISLSDLSQRAGLAPSSAYRLLTTLAARGHVEFLERDQLWAIGVEAFRTGMAFQRRNSIASLGRPIMQDLVQASGESANIAIFEGGEIVFVAQIETQEPIRAFFRSGERRAAHASGIGKALLAEMPRKDVEAIIRDKGVWNASPTAPSSNPPLCSPTSAGPTCAAGRSMIRSAMSGCAVSPPRSSTSSAIPWPGSRSPALSPGSTMPGWSGSGRSSRPARPRSRGSSAG